MKKFSKIGKIPLEKSVGFIINFFLIIYFSTPNYFHILLLFNNGNSITAFNHHVKTISKIITYKNFSRKKKKKCGLGNKVFYFYV